MKIKVSKKLILENNAKPIIIIFNNENYGTDRMVELYKPNKEKSN